MMDLRIQRGYLPADDGRDNGNARYFAGPGDRGGDNRSEAGRKEGGAVSRERKDMGEAGHKGGETPGKEKKHGPEFYSEIDKKGSEKVGEKVKEEKGPEFYSEIGKKSDEKVGEDREHMAEIGKKGGESRGEQRQEEEEEDDGFQGGSQYTQIGDPNQIERTQRLSAVRREAGRKGGQKVSQNRQHMAEIGRKGGQKVSQDRQHMAEIGRKGGQSRGKRSLTTV